MRKENLLVLGMDERQRCLINYLCQDGFQVTASDNFINGTFDAVLLPLSQTGSYLDKESQNFTPNQYIYGCSFPKELQKILEEKGIHFIDYCKIPGVAIANGVATAEGVICEMIKRSKINIAGSNCLVYGFGKCGEIIADRLNALKAYVSVYARSIDARQRAYSYGYKQADDTFENYDFIINTVPSMSNNNKPVIDEPKLKECTGKLLILDIATGGGVDFYYCKQKRIEAVLLPGLPGKYSPRTSAKILFDVIKQTLPEV